METPGAAWHSGCMTISVSIVEDNHQLRDSVAALIGGSPGFRCASTHGSTEEALRDLPGSRPDVVLMDINLPGKNGIECVRRLKEKQPALPIVMFTVYEQSEQVFEALRAGACGYLLKATPPAELLEALTEVHRGGSPMSTAIARKVVASFHAAARHPAPETEALTARESEILAALARGARNKEIAGQLHISLDTVRTHLRHIYEKLHVNSRTEAVLKYVRA
jgi:DNA-binding NarL/FixJ family response regulator